MLSIYKDLYELSGSKLNPLVGKTLSDMGYDENYTLKQKSKISPVPSLNNALIIDNRTIKTAKPLLFDFGALGKGYFVDKVSNFLKTQKIKRFMVNGSGDIFYQGNEHIRAGLEHPVDPTKVIGLLNMKTGALCASANNRRAWRNFTHTINPQTLNSNHDILATWVYSQCTAIADALATALFMTPPEKYEDKYKFEYLILNNEFKVKKSEGFEVELF
jgi:thiamine biosynthesis lipoprotein